MDTGTKISGLAHVGLITWVMVGGLFSGAEQPTQVQVSEVSLITSEEFAALSRPPEATAIEPAEPAPEPEPQPEPEPEPAPAEPEVIDAPADPEPEVPSEPVIPEPAPAPRPADRVAPEPAPAPPEDAAPSDSVQEAVVPEPAESPDDVVEEPQEAEAPEAATTQIITEATETDEDGASTAPVSSPRPQVRPERPEPAQTAEPAPEPQPETEPEPQPTPEPDREAVEEALAAALGETDAQGTSSPQPEAPAGPPMTDGERDALRLSVQRCWNVGALSSEALGVTVTVAFSMNPDATPEAGSLRMAGASGGSDAAARQAYETARRAILRCGADGFDLPSEKYEQWRDIEMVFNPESMRIR